MRGFFSFSEPLGQCRIYRICPPTQNEHPQAFPAQAARFPDAPLTRAPWARRENRCPALKMALWG